MMMRLRQPAGIIRSAFTLVELLVVIAIIGLLLAILLPAMTAAVEGVRRVTCQSRIRDLGLALLAYHQTHQVLPAAADGGTASVYLSFTGYSRLLPFLEQTPVYDQLNFEASVRLSTLDYTWATPANTTAYAIAIDAFLCPSNRRNSPTPMEFSITGTSIGAVDWALASAAVTDYLFSAGADRFIDARFWQPDKRGAFGFYSATRLADFEDGLSRTILIGESAGGRKVNRYYAHDQAGGSGEGVLIDAETGGTYRRLCFPVTQPHPTASFPVVVDNLMYMAYGRNRACKYARLNVIGGLVARTADAHGNPYPPNDCAYASSTDLFANPPATPRIRSQFAQTVPNFRSAHPGIVHVVMADGNVETITDSVDAQLFVGLSTIAGAEIQAP